MKPRKIIFGLVALMVLVSLACASGVDPKTAAAGTVLFQDDFSKKTGGVDTTTVDQGVTDYGDGVYRIYVNEVNYYMWANPKDMGFGDVIVEVDGTKIGGPDANDIGVICRYTDESNFYFFTIGSDGYYAISKLINGEETLVGMEEFGFDDQAIQTGNATNHIRADCVGSTLTLSVNGVQLVSAQDSGLATGNVGLIGGTWETPGTDVNFDNFKVTKP